MRYREEHPEEYKKSRREKYAALPEEEKQKRRAKCLEGHYKNKEKRNADAKAYRAAHLEEIKAKEKARYHENVESEKAKAKIRRSDPEFREQSRQRSAEWRRANPEKTKAWREANPDYDKKWREENRDRLNAKQREAKNDPVVRMQRSVRRMLAHAFKGVGIKKSKRTETILGCSFAEFKAHIEAKFAPWMTWENYGLYNGTLNYGWHLDHIIPLSTAKTAEDVIRLSHWTNHQPLCAYANMHLKKNKLDWLPPTP